MREMHKHRVCPSVKFHLPTTERYFNENQCWSTPKIVKRITEGGISGSHTGADEVKSSGAWHRGDW